MMEHVMDNNKVIVAGTVNTPMVYSMRCLRKIFIILN